MNQQPEAQESAPPPPPPPPLTDAPPPSAPPPVTSSGSGKLPFRIGQWGGLPQYICQEAECAFDTLNEQAIWDHFRGAHKVAAVTYEAQIRASQEGT